MRRAVLLLVLGFVFVASFAGTGGVCTRVVDGDTIVVDLDGVLEKVRLIGVDTPETVHPRKPVEYFGREASAYTKAKAEGAEVTLEYDHQRRGKYGRLLAYVYIDGSMLNADLIEDGYGFAYTKYPFRYMEAFRSLEREARDEGRGLWAERAMETAPEEETPSNRAR